MDVLAVETAAAARAGGGRGAGGGPGDRGDGRHQRVADPGRKAPDALAYGLGLLIAALSLARRRWPLAVLLASAATLLFYNLFDYPGLFSAVPLSVALATVWAAGRRGWALAIAIWFGVTPLIFLALSDLPADFESRLVTGAVSDLALLAAVLLLGEAVRGRRALDAEHRLLLAERERSERLLLNVLPAPIAARLKQGEEVIADGFPEVTVLFADLVDFTRRSQRDDPGAGGAGPRRPVLGLRPAGRAARAGEDQDHRRRLHGRRRAARAPARPRRRRWPRWPSTCARRSARHLDPGGQPLAVRIGIDTGPVVAGVIGRRKFSYDLWGDTVNTASRMESHGVAGCIQVTDRTYRRLRDGYRFERRGPVQVKGKGELVTWFLVGRAGQPR